MGLRITDTHITLTKCEGAKAVGLVTLNDEIRILVTVSDTPQGLRVKLATGVEFVSPVMASTIKDTVLDAYHHEVILGVVNRAECPSQYAALEVRRVRKLLGSMRLDEIEADRLHISLISLDAIIKTLEGK